MQKQFIIVSNGPSKDTGKPSSRAAAVKSSRDGKSNWVDLKDVMYLEEIKPIGNVFMVEMTIK